MRVSDLVELRPAAIALKVLSDESRPCYKKEIERRTEMGGSTLDSALDVLVTEGLISFTKSDGAGKVGKGRAHGFYTVTKKGATFDRWVRDWEEQIRSL